MPTTCPGCGREIELHDDVAEPLDDSGIYHADCYRDCDFPHWTADWYVWDGE